MPFRIALCHLRERAVRQMVHLWTERRLVPPGAAWKEAMRRTMVISIAGFFVPILFANFYVIPQLHQSFQFMPGVCGAAGMFSASMVLFLGYFNRELIQGAVATSGGLILPYAVTWLWFQLTHPSAHSGLLQLFGPTVVIAIADYFALMCRHARRSDLTLPTLTG